MSERPDGSTRRTGGFMPVAVVGACGLAVTLLLSWQAVELRQRASATEVELHSLEETLGWNLHLSAMEGRGLPAPLAESLRSVISTEQGEMGRETLLITYMPTVCSSCLRSGLRALAEAEPDLRRNGIEIRALTSDRRESRELAVSLRGEGLLRFSVGFLSGDAYLESLPGGTNPTFADTPVYFRLGPDLQVASVFKADQKRPELLNQWIAANWSSRPDSRR